MARILYAVAGDGFGHATRAHSVAERLLARGHDVQLLTSHKGRDYLLRYFPGRIHDVLGLLTIHREGHVRLFRTVTFNTAVALRAMRASNRSVLRLFDRLQPDLVVTDFEPFAPFWANRLGVPFLSLDNQHLLTHCRIDVPWSSAFDFLAAYLTVRLYYVRAKRYLITSFIDAPVIHQPATVLPPVLRPKLYTVRPRAGDFLLAYKGAGGENAALQDTLRGFDRMPVVAYGFGALGVRGGTTYKAIDPEGFLDDLAGCAGVIATAGHSLVCECLHLRKPLLLQPVAHQFEQIVNAYHVERMGVGLHRARIDVRGLEDFADRLDGFRAALDRLPEARLCRVIAAVERELP